MKISKIEHLGIAVPSIEEALPYALALEYIHTYSLIHDDLPAGQTGAQFQQPQI